MPTSCVQPQRPQLRVLSLWRARELKQISRQPLNRNYSPDLLTCINAQRLKLEGMFSFLMLQFYLKLASTSLTLQLLEVTLMLLIMAGDVEINPDPTTVELELTLQNLEKELQDLIEPILFGVKLGVPQTEITIIQDDHRNDLKGRRLKVLQYIAANIKPLKITWSRIAQALEEIGAGDLAHDIRTKYCQSGPDSSLASCDLDHNPSLPLSNAPIHLPGPTTSLIPFGTDTSTTELEIQCNLESFSESQGDGSISSEEYVTADEEVLENSEIPPHTVQPVEEPHSIPEDMSSSSIRQMCVKLVCGCTEKCNVHDYIAGKYCSNPRQLPFPILKLCEDLTDSTVIDIEKFVYILGKQYKEIKKIFNSMILETIIEFIEKKINLELVKTFVHISFESSNNSIPQPPDLFKTELRKIHDFNSLFEYLNEKYCSWFEYELIEELRRKFLFRSDHQEQEPLTDHLIDDYKTKFSEYVKHRCFLYHGVNLHPENRSNGINVQFKIGSEFSKLTTDQIKHYKNKFLEIIGISKYILTFEKAESGCTELTFRAPQYLNEVRTLSPDQSMMLRELKFLLVKIGDHCIFSELESQGMSSSSGEINLLVQDEYEQPSPEVSHDEAASHCAVKIEWKEQIPISGSLCTLWRAKHNDESLVLKYNGKDKLNFVKYAEDLLKTKNHYDYVVAVNCIHKETDSVTVVFEKSVSLRDYCSTCSEIITEIEQLSYLFNVALGCIGLQSITGSVRITQDSLYVKEESNGQIKGLFLPLYKPDIRDDNDCLNLEWLNDSLNFMHYRKEYDGNSKLPESHILYNIMKYKWFSQDKEMRPKDVTEVAKDMEFIMELEKTHQDLVLGLSGSSGDLKEVAHLHMLLLGHTGVGKTSIRKHLQNLPFNEEEKTTIIMEPELLVHQTIEATMTDSSSFIFQQGKNVYKSEEDKVFLTLWDSGGQPMFQDLLPCFAKLRSIYGIVFRLCDLINNSKALIRPVCSLELETSAPYTYSEYLHRCIAFFESFSLRMTQDITMLPDQVKEVLSGLQSFPRMAMIGTHKDTIHESDIKVAYKQLIAKLESTDFLNRALSPSEGSTLFEVDNTRSGAMYEDPGIHALREQIVTCAQDAKVKIPSKWIAFKIHLERESHLQQPCTGIIAFDKAEKIAKQHSVNTRAALCYFHELGIFIWYHDKPKLQDYAIIEPKNLLSILGTILNPEAFTDLPDQWRHLQARGILDEQVGSQLLESSKTGLPLSWILSFFEEHHLAMPLQEGYFIPSMLRDLPACPNHNHAFNVCSSSCTILPSTSKLAPLFLVPKSKVIPPGLFPRLMTVLAGIQQGTTVWKLSTDCICRSMVTFDINACVRLAFTEFIDCIRIHCVQLGEISKQIYLTIVSTLEVQLQRILDQKSIQITFACSCSGSSTTHFLNSLPFATDDLIPCSQHSGQNMKLTRGHKIWLTDEPIPQIFSRKDAETKFKAAIKGNTFNLQLTTVLFTGLPDSDIKECKQMIMEKNTPPSRASQSLNSAQADIGVEISYFSISGEKIKGLQDADLNKVFASNAALAKCEEAVINQEHAVDTARSFPSRLEGDVKSESQPKGVNDESKYQDKSIDKPEHYLSTISNDSSVQSISDSKAEVNQVQKQATRVTSKQATQLASEPATQTSNSHSAEISNHHSTEPLTSEILLKYANPNRVLDLMVGRLQKCSSLELISSICCSDLWQLKILPIFLQDITLGINCLSLTSTDDVSKQLFLYISNITTKVMLVERFEHSKSTSLYKQKLSQLMSQCSDSLITDEIIDISNSLNTIEDALLSLSSSNAPKAVPFSWYMLGHAVRKLMKDYSRKIISKQDVIFMAKQFEIVDDEVEVALLSLHMDGFILYFGNVLPNVIFSDPIFFLDILTKLRQNHNHGVVILTSLSGVYFDGLFTHKELLLVLKELHLAIEMATPSNSTVLPCLVEDIVPINTDDLMVCSPGIVPILIRYSTTPGVFEHLICFLCSPHMYNGLLWPWKIKTESSFELVYSNYAQFFLPGCGVHINLLMAPNYEDYHDQITVSITFQRKEEHALLPLIKQAILDGLKATLAAFHYKEHVALFVGFNCSCGQDDHKHIMLINKAGVDEANCSLTNHPIKLSTTHQKWFSIINRSNRTISRERMFAKLLPWASEWYGIGTLLGLSSDILQILSTHYRKVDPTDALTGVVMKWFETHHNPSWEEVQKVMGKVQSELCLHIPGMKAVFETRKSKVTLWLSISTLLPYLLKYNLVNPGEEVDSIQSPFIDNATKLNNLFTLIQKNGGERGYSLLYNCLEESMNEYNGHNTLVNALVNAIKSVDLYSGEVRKRASSCRWEFEDHSILNHQYNDHGMPFRSRFASDPLPVTASN